MTHPENAQSLSDTPRVDALAYDDDGRTWIEHSITGRCVSADLARTLEREAAALRDDRDALKLALQEISRNDPFNQSAAGVMAQQALAAHGGKS